MQILPNKSRDLPRSSPIESEVSPSESEPKVQWMPAEKGEEAHFFKGLQKERFMEKLRIPPYL
jgi:hypothetical protein